MAQFERNAHVHPSGVYLPATSAMGAPSTPTSSRPSLSHTPSGMPVLGNPFPDLGNTPRVDRRISFGNTITTPIVRAEGQSASQFSGSSSTVTTPGARVQVQSDSPVMVAQEVVHLYLVLSHPSDRGRHRRSTSSLVNNWTAGSKIGCPRWRGVLTGTGGLARRS